MLAKPAHASDQVAALIGFKPAASDPGQPVRLALQRRQPHCRRRAVPPRRAAQAAPLQVAEVAPRAAVAQPPPARARQLRLAPAPAAGPRRACRARAGSAGRCRRIRAVDRAGAAAGAPGCAELRRASASSAAAPHVRLLPRDRQFDGGRPARRLRLVRSASPPPGTAAAKRYCGASRLLAGERPLRQPEGHGLPPVGQGLRQRPRGAPAVRVAAPAPAAAASSAPSPATLRSSSPRARPGLADQQFQAGHPHGHAHFDLKHDQRPLGIVGDRARRSRRRDSSGRDA